MSLTEDLKAHARELGFAAVGIAAAEPLGEEARHLRAYLAHGRHGTMAWMAATEAVRADPAHAGMLPAARSVVVMAAPYARGAERVGPAPGRVARYARGRDYHNVLSKRARKLSRELKSRGFEARVAVDSMPVFERAWAERAGIGFVGKNCCLIVPGVGSHVFLVCIVTSAELVPDPPMKRRCGSCTACLDACPTGAFRGERQLDARDCISYLTIENRGEIPERHRAALGDWIFGCDVCQDVCPYNQTSLPDEATTQPFASHPRWEEHSAGELLSLDESSFREYAIGSPIKRAGVLGMARNAAVVLGNSGDRRHLPVLQKAAGGHSDSIVREAAEWAVGRLTVE